MDVGTTEKLDLRALGGNDNTVINNLSGTPVNTVVVDGGEGNDTFIGSALRETFLGGGGNDTARFGAGDFFDMGADTDEIEFFATNGNDNIHVDAKQRDGNDELFLHGNVGNQRAVFNNGEIVTVFTLGGNDKVKIHNKASDLWDVNVVD
jgi:Ca2+-binding RTX toxin-like protein